jgi:hypothetical protein
MGEFDEEGQFWFSEGADQPCEVCECEGGWLACPYEHDAPDGDANAQLRAARSAVRAERARQMRNRAWAIEFWLEACDDEKQVAAWLAERDALLEAADALDAGGAA